MKYTMYLHWIFVKIFFQLMPNFPSIKAIKRSRSLDFRLREMPQLSSYKRAPSRVLNTENMVVLMKVIVKYKYPNTEFDICLLLRSNDQLLTDGRLF